jgi:hypothetical protein
MPTVLKEKFHEVHEVRFSGTVMALRCDGAEHVVDISGVSDRLARATAAERALFRISPSGYGIHWPAIDEDLSVDGLIHASEAQGTKPNTEPAQILRDSQDRKQ